MTPTEIDRLQELPKLDLHVHLEGAARPMTISTIADHHNSEFNHFRSWGSKRFGGIRQFIDYYLELDAILTEPEHLYQIATEFCEDQANHGVRYSEVTFTLPPRARAMNDWEVPLTAVLEGLKDGANRYGSQAGVILDILREGDLDDASRTCEVASAWHGRGVVGLGLTGMETAPIRSELIRMLHSAVDEGLAVIPHAGELGDSPPIWEVLARLPISRIGHGLGASRDKELLENLKRMDVTLEICISSNLATGVVTSVGKHPLRTIAEAGVKYVICSDDPGLFGISITDEYRLATDMLGLDDAKLITISRNAIMACHADSASRASLFAELDAWACS